MQLKSRQELYQSFVEFIEDDIQRERHRVNRRMFSVFFWCFLLPAVLSATTLFLVKAGIFPRTARNHLDWLILIFPVLYSLYVLGSEVLAQIPAAIRRGGVASTLGQAVREGEWRDRVSESMSRGVSASDEEWEWIVRNFEMDLQALQYRTKFLTALGGAVFLLMQGIDSLADDDSKLTLIKTPLMGWVETSSNNFSQYVGLALFLVLLYLSGSQTSQTLNRYLNCAELVLRKSKMSGKR